MGRGSPVFSWKWEPFDIKTIQIRKEKVKLSLYSDDVTLNIKNSNNKASKNSSKWNYNTIRLQAIKLMLKSVEFLYRNNEVESKNLRTLSSLNPFLQTKIPGNQLNKEGERHIMKTIKSLLRKMEDTRNIKVLYIYWLK